MSATSDIDLLKAFAQVLGIDRDQLPPAPTPAHDLCDGLDQDDLVDHADVDERRAEAWTTEVFGGGSR